MPRKFKSVRRSRSATNSRVAAQVRAMFKKGWASHQKGQIAEAEEHYQQVLKIHPQHFDALHLLGVIALQNGNAERAVELIGKAIEIDPSSAAAYYNRGIALQHLSQYEGALENYDKAIALKPDYAAAYYNRGKAQQELKQHEAAVQSYDKAVALKPDHAKAYNNRGTALRDLKQHEAALQSYDRAIALKPHYPAAYNNRGNALRDLEQHEAAVQSYDKAIALKAEYPEAYNNRGIALHDLKQHQAAVQSYDKAIALKPDYAEASFNHGNVLRELKRHDAALRSYDKAIALKPDSAGAYHNRGYALQELKRYPEAIASFDRALATNPDIPYCAGDRAHCGQHICDWRDLEPLEQQIVARVRSGQAVTSPFAFLSISAIAADQLSCARSHVRHRFPAIASSLMKSPPRQHDRIRIAYLSGDFRDHPVAYLMAGTFEKHDRAQFEVSAISFGPDKHSKMRSRLMRAFDRFIDVRTKSNVAVARLVEELEIDILVDLMGYTKHSRTGILAHRPAPVQVNLLGFPGTMGADYIDYIIADEFVIPAAEQRYYSEKVVYLPDCFQPNDSKRKIGVRTRDRAEAGLPERGFVFCCFNNSYKIKSEIFDVWIRVLRRVKNSVLWLLGENDIVIANLRREAQSRGVEPERLVFAKRVGTEDYLARYRLADLFLDTLPFNAGTTASDALWAGVPLVTCAGSAFAARMAGSLVHAVGLPELVTHSLEDYEALAVKLAIDERLLTEIKETLSKNRLTKPLFDTDRFRRHIEAAYTTMWEIHHRGGEPRSFAVPSCDPGP